MEGGEAHWDLVRVGLPGSDAPRRAVWRVDVGVGPPEQQQRSRSVSVGNCGARRSGSTRSSSKSKSKSKSSSSRWQWQQVAPAALEGHEFDRDPQLLEVVPHLENEKQTVKYVGLRYQSH